MAITFRTAVVRTPNGPDSIEIIDVPVVEPGPGQVRVDVAGAAVNPVDLALAARVFRRRGLVHQPHHTGLRWDFAGIVSATGPGVDIAVGSRVAGLVDGFDPRFRSGPSRWSATVARSWGCSRGQGRQKCAASPSAWW